MEKIRKDLEELHDVLCEISPLRNISEDPFGSNTEYSAEISAVLASLISKASQEKERIENTNNQLKFQIHQFCNQLQIESPAIPQIDNLVVMGEYLKNELDKILIVRNTLKNAIDVIVTDIKELSRDLGDNAGLCLEFASDEISVERQEQLSILKNNLLEKIATLEAQRQDFYDGIIALNYRMSRTADFTYEEKIGELRRMLKTAQNEYDKMKEEYESLSIDIRRMAGILNVEPREFPGSMSDSAVVEMRKYREELKMEQKRLFDEIYDRTLQEITILSGAVGKKVPEQERTEAALVWMRDELTRLYPMKKLYDEIVEKIQKRRELLGKMTEFEKIASDPRRLFRSSFQLNSEEKFRNSAYPSLLKMEEGLFELVEQFETQFGAFIFEGIEFRSALRNEIENRIINRTVFISRCDSPFRKKK